jgi:hypothetical protein
MLCRWNVLAATSGGNPSALTTALIALGGAVVGGLITASGQLLVERSRSKHETEREAVRVDREAKAAEGEHLQLLIEDAIAAAQRAMTYFESRQGWHRAAMHEHAQAVRVALWRLALYLGDGHKLVVAYDAVTEAFKHWNAVAIGAAESAPSPSGEPSSRSLFRSSRADNPSFRHRP